MRPNPNNYVNWGLKTIFCIKSTLKRSKMSILTTRIKHKTNFFDVKKIFLSKFFSSKFFWKLKNLKSRLASTFEQFFSKDCRCQNMNGASKIMSELDQAILKGHNMRLLGPNLELYFWPPYTGPYTGIFHPRVAV